MLHVMHYMIILNQSYFRVVLRFGAKMILKTRENNERVFVINYFLSDDTISVHELARRNSGFLGGEFFKRAKFFLPGQGSLYTSNRPKIYQSHHFFLGSKVNLMDYIFDIISVDIFALNFMEQNKEEVGQKLYHKFHFSKFMKFHLSIQCRTQR